MKLGDILEAKGVNWRADLREAGIERRARPDRGFIEQPEERVAPRRVVIPMERLEQVLREDREEPAVHQPIEKAPISAGPSTIGAAALEELRRQSEPQSGQSLVKVNRSAVYAQPPPAPPPEASDDDEGDGGDGSDDEGRTRKRKVFIPTPEKLSTIRRIMRGEETLAQAAARLNVSKSAVALWREMYLEAQELDPHAPSITQTMVSGSRPPSLPMAAANGPARLEISVAGLEHVVAQLVDERIEAQIAARIADAVKAELRRRLAGD